MRFRLLPVAAVVAVLVAACGGSSTPTTTKTTTPHKSAVTRTKTAASAGMTTKPSAATTSSVSESVSTSSQPTFASATNCTQLAGVGEQFAKAMSSATSGGKFDLSKVAAAYQSLANAAPSAIRPDIQVLAGAFTSYAADLSKAGYTFGTVPSASQISAIENAVKVFDAAKLKAATKHLEAWAAQNCK